MSTPNVEETVPAAQGGVPAYPGTGKSMRTGRAISVVFFMTIAARLLTIVSQIVMAAVFGTSKSMDAYVLALIVPITIANILNTAVGAAFIPVFIDYRENKGEAEAMRVLWAGAMLGLLATIVVTAIMIAGAPLIIMGFGHQMDAPTQALAAVLLRFLLPIVVLQAIITLLGAVLNVYGRFALPSLAPGVVPLSLILFLVLANSSGIYALGWGTLVGYVINLLLLVVAYVRIGLRVQIVFDWHDPGVRRIIALTTPALVSALLVNVNVLIDQFMAAMLPAGNLSALSYAVKLVDGPSQFFYLALSTALLPLFSMQVARREFNLLRDTFRQVVIFAAIGLLPAGALLCVLADPVVTIVLQHGQFTDASSNVVAGAVALLAPSMFLFSYSFINGRIYNALQDNWTLRNVSILSLMLNAVLDFILMQFWGVAGIAFSTTLTYLITATTLLLILNRKLGGINLGRLGLALGKAALAAALMGAACALLEQVPLIAGLPPLAEVCVLGVIGSLMYLALLLALRMRELNLLWNMVRARLPGGCPAVEAV
jgi:putative peptidoglycan lipid II flippase